MELTFRNLRLINRLLKKPYGFPAFRCSSNAIVKEEYVPELLNSYNRDIKDGGAVPIFKRALLFPSRIALQDEIGSYTYASLYQAASALSKDIAVELLGERERTISYMCSNDASHVIVQWAIWMTGNIAVPLTPIHPAEMLKYFITDSSSSLVICSQNFEKLLHPIAQSLSKPIIITSRPDEKMDSKNEGVSLKEVGQTNNWYGNSDAMLIYTSGTTSKPKGVVWTHKMLNTQISALHTAWQYSCHDVVLHTLPLHHIHGQLNSLNASLAAGARIRMLPSFSSPAVWARLLGNDKEDRVSVFHGVPAMYSRLVTDYDNMFSDNKTREYVRNTLSTKMRLMCAGSAPLPETLFNKWEEISGIKLLERYGMSEVGMALSNPYRPAQARTVAHVGAPLPAVGAALAASADGLLKPLLVVHSDEPDLQISLEKLNLAPSKVVEENEWKTNVNIVEPNEEGVYEGELLLKGPAVFTRYWNRAPNPDSPDFTPDGWFRTGDMASYSNGKFRILGRTSVDIIKTGGYKVSALQVESAILEHPNVLDAAVVGIEDNSYGEIVSTVVVLKDKTSLTLKELKDEAGKKLAPYQLPKTMLIVDEMPRNAMGKLDKKVIKQKFGDKLLFKKA